jgi:hypothetical protein
MNPPKWEATMFVDLSGVVTVPYVFGAPRAEGESSAFALNDATVAMVNVLSPPPPAPPAAAPAPPAS